MDAKQREFVETYAKSCDTHDEWLTFVRYGLPTLLEDQNVLIGLIIREAERTARDRQDARSAIATQILEELGLRLEAA